MKDLNDPHYQDPATIIEAQVVGKPDDENYTANNNSTPKMPSKLNKQFSTIDEAYEEGGTTNSSSSTNDFEVSDDEDSMEEDPNCVTSIQNKTKVFCGTYSSVITKIVAVVCLILYTVYFAFAINYSYELAETLIWITVLVVLCIVYVFIRDTFGDQISEHCLDPMINFISQRWSTLQW